MTRRRRWGVAVLALLVAGAAPRDAGAQRLNPMTALLEAGETVFGPICIRGYRIQKILHDPEPP